MDLREARIMVMDLMTLHGVDEHHFEWMNKKNRLGEVTFNRALNVTTLRLSLNITRLQPAAEVEQTILHEIAHILAGPDHGHDWTWKRIARSIGYEGERTASVPEEHHINQNWVGQCPNGHLSSRVRRPKAGRTTSCGKCSRTFDARYLITWTPGPEFRVALRRAAAAAQTAAQETL